MRTDDLYSLPAHLPVPEDDGACNHLRRAMLPSIGLRATSGQTVDLPKEGRPWLVIYCYPRTGRPDQEPPGGAEAWNAIPGARGCTPQSCAYDDDPTAVRWLYVGERCTRCGVLGCFLNLAFRSDGRSAPTSIDTPQCLSGLIVTVPIYQEAFKRSLSEAWARHHALADARAIHAGYRAWRVANEEALDRA